MSIDWQVLGRPGADNAVLLTVDTGQATHPLLFDCGEGVLDSLRIGQVQSVEHLAFSHFHMDHVCGFDSFFRHNYNRPEGLIRIWGPAGTRSHLHHRFLSFCWNLHREQPGEWVVSERDGERVAGSRFFTREAFATAHDLPERCVPDPTGPIYESPAFRLEAIELPHRDIVSLGYRVSESDRVNVSPEALRELGWEPGPWLQSLTDASVPADRPVKAGRESRTTGELRESLLTRSPGEAVAVLTDFSVLPGQPGWESLVAWLAGVGTLICECQYGDADRRLAEQNGHMTTCLVGRLAREAGVKRLVLQHLSRRYSREQWIEMRDEARTEFPGAEFPPEWDLGRTG